MGISTSLYFPARGTAGLLLLTVSGNRREPAPPPRITATTDLLIHIFLNLKVRFLNKYPGHFILTFFD
jgi:hypothetical protein